MRRADANGPWSVALVGLLLATVTLHPIGVAADIEPEAAFRQLLADYQLQLSAPTGFGAREIAPNSIIDYEGALRAEDDSMEIRYVIRPVSAMQIDYDDPHGAIPNPNHIFPLLFEAMVTRLSDGGRAPSRAFPDERAQQDFNADWAAAAAFDVVDKFSADFSQGVIVALHRQGTVDAYTIVLYNDYEIVKDRLDTALHSLTFLSKPVS